MKVKIKKLKRKFANKNTYSEKYVRAHPGIYELAEIDGEVTTNNKGFVFISSLYGDIRFFHYETLIDDFFPAIWEGARFRKSNCIVKIYN